jgi:hypothetical protein
MRLSSTAASPCASVDGDAAALCAPPHLAPAADRYASPADPDRYAVGEVVNSSAELELEFDAATGLYYEPKTGAYFEAMEDEGDGEAAAADA